MVVGIALMVFVIVQQLVLLGIAVVFEQEVLTFLSVLDIFSEMIGSVFMAFSIIVIVFAILQWFDVKPDEDEEWDPRELPEIEPKDTVNRTGTVVEITFSLVIIAVLLFLPDKIGVWVSPGTEILINPVISQLYPTDDPVDFAGYCAGCDLTLAGKVGDCHSPGENSDQPV